MPAPGKVNTALPCDPAILLLGVCLRTENIRPHRIEYTNVHGSIIIICKSRKWKPLKCPPMDEWVSQYGLCMHWDIIQPLKGVKHNVDEP